MNLFKTKSRFPIGRVCIAGSTGKKTTINNSDVDCVLFINDAQPPFAAVLDDLENILTMADAYKIRNVRKTKYSIQFKAFDLDFDILPAANFTVNESVGGDALINLQQQRVLAHIK